MTEIITVEPMPEKVSVIPEETDYTVIASNPAEMAAAHDQMVDWATNRIAVLEVEQKDIDENLTVAIKNKWRTSTLKAQNLRTIRRVQYYVKIKAALEAGYYIVPNFPIDIFAIRTTKRSPIGHVRQNANWGTPHLNPQVSDNPALADGRYVSTQASEYHDHGVDSAGNKQISTWAHDFQDIDFPFALAKPKILKDTAQAMALKCFDEIGILVDDRRENSNAQRSGDPMVIGRINRRISTYNVKSISFVISWFLDTKDL